MTKRQFYTYTFDYNVNDNNSRYTIGNSFFAKFPHLEGIVKLEEFAIPENLIKDFAPGKKWNYRLAYLEADDESLASFGTSVSEILARGKSVYAYHDILERSNDEACEWIRQWTTAEEAEPRKFKVSEAYADIITGNTIPEKFLIIP